LVERLTRLDGVGHAHSVQPHQLRGTEPLQQVQQHPVELVRLEVLEQVRVSGKQLVGAVAAQGDADVLALFIA